MGVPTHTHTHIHVDTHTQGLMSRKLDSGTAARRAWPRVYTHVHVFTLRARTHTHTPGGSADRQDRSKATPGGNLNFKTRDQSLGADIIISHTRSEPRLG